MSGFKALTQTLASCRTVLIQSRKNVSRRVYYQANNLIKNRNVKFFGALVACGTISLFGITYYVLYASTDERKKKKLVILGSGWGAVSVLRYLSPDKYDISIISPDNYFLLTPLLPGVTVGTVEGRSIIEPIRKVLSKRHKDDSKFFEAECTRVNVENKQVTCQDLSKITGLKEEFSLDYDYLVVAVGAQTATFNIKGVSQYTHFLKTVHQAQEIRKNILDSFETAALPGQPDYEQRRLLHFVVVGGGPTGVEFAAELRDFVKKDLLKDYPQNLVDKAKITLVDGLDKVLNTYSEEISRYTEGRFKKEGINVVMNTFVTEVDKNNLHLMDSTTKERRMMNYGMCVWCAGIAPRDLTKQLISDIPNQTNRMGLITDGHFKVKSASNIFAIGDCCTIENDEFATIIEELFTNQNAFSVAQVESVLEEGSKRYPKFCHQFSMMKKELELHPPTENNFEKIKAIAVKTSAKETALPPTAQVAAQEGKYLGKLLSNNVAEIDSNSLNEVTPFKYKHLGSFAYIGDNQAVLELPIVGAMKGLSAMWLWRGTYTNECVSMRMRTLVVLDWIKSYIFGRDTSRI